MTCTLSNDDIAYAPSLFFYSPHVFAFLSAFSDCIHSFFISSINSCSSHFLISHLFSLHLNPFPLTSVSTLHTFLPGHSPPPPFTHSLHYLLLSTLWRNSSRLLLSVCYNFFEKWSCWPLCVSCVEKQELQLNPQQKYGINYHSQHCSQESLGFGHAVSTLKSKNTHINVNVHSSQTKCKCAPD